MQMTILNVFSSVTMYTNTKANLDKNETVFVILPTNRVHMPQEYDQIIIFKLIILMISTYLQNILKYVDRY